MNEYYRWIPPVGVGANPALRSPSHPGRGGCIQMPPTSTRLHFHLKALFLLSATARIHLLQLTMSISNSPIPPYPLHPSIKDKLDPEYVAFYNEFVINLQQVHLQPVEASRTSGILIPGGGPLIDVAKSEDITIKRRQTTGPDVTVRCFTPEGEKPAGGWPVMLYFHGGGWVLGNINTENTVCTNLCARGRCVVVTVDYRFVPFLGYAGRGRLIDCRQTGAGGSLASGCP